MKKLLALLVSVLMLMVLLTGCAPELPTAEEAEALATELLAKVMGVFNVKDYEIAKYFDGEPKEYLANDTYFYFVENFEDIKFDTNSLLDAETIKLKNQLGLRMTQSDGTFIKSDSYFDLTSKNLFTGEYTVKADTIEQYQITFVVTCKYFVDFESTETETRDYKLTIHQYMVEMPGEDGKTAEHYYWLISEMFNPLEMHAVADTSNQNNG